jgi:mRNA-degrading endonuclease YafQ of YafQ-DinJ toxin-antitoxin module
MAWRLVITASYEKKLKRFLKKHPEVLERYAKAMVLLERDPWHPSLRPHKLKGRLREYHSISITLSYRVVIDLVIEDENIIPLDIGTHDEVY